jgi:hypothetical protein
MRMISGISKQHTNIPDFPANIKNYPPPKSKANDYGLVGRSSFPDGELSLQCQVRISTDKQPSDYPMDEGGWSMNVVSPSGYECVELYPKHP